MAKKSQIKRINIVNMAIEMILKDGMINFSLRKLAHRLEMQLSNLQYYFPAKELLLQAVIKVCWENSEKKLKAIEEKFYRDGDIFNLMIEVAEIRKNDDYIVQELMTFANREENFASLIEDTLKSYVKYFKRIVKYKYKDLSKDQISQKVFCLMALISGAVRTQQWIGDIFSAQKEIRRMINAIFQK